MDAGQDDSAKAQQALGTLCQTYWYPLYAYIRRRGYGAADAEDLTQGFFERLLRLKSLAEVKRERGRFRSFLLASLNHYLADAWDRESAGKRDVRRTLSLDTGDAETRYHQEPVSQETPERLFNRQWALALLEVVVQRLQQQCEADGKQEEFMALRFAITAQAQELPYAQLAEKLGKSEAALRVAAHRLRRQYREILRQEIAQTTASADDVEEELKDLFAAL